jgi:hypothetical protein
MVRSNSGSNVYLYQSELPQPHVRHVTFRCIADIDCDALEGFIDQAIARSDHDIHATHRSGHTSAADHPQ